jgi:hypothetical protein
MNKIGTFGLAVAFAAFFVVTADAQRRPARPTTPRVVTSNTAAAQTTTLRQGADKVSIQIKNVTKFLYLLGGAAAGIEDIDKDPRANAAARSKNAENKRALIQTIQNLRAGMLALEVEFRTKEPLKRHLPLIQGITELSAQSEDLAAAGRFTDSGRPLLTLVEKLSDALAAM